MREEMMSFSNFTVAGYTRCIELEHFCLCEDVKMQLYIDNTVV